MHLKKYINKQFLRFLIGGFLNTGLSYLLYLVFLNFWSYKVSYTLSFIIGIIVAYLYNSKWVFNSKLSWVKVLKYPLIYCIQYLLNLIALYALVEKMHINDKVSPLIATVLIIPVTFVLNKMILQGKK